MTFHRRPPCILGVGTNYQDHIDEFKGQRPEHPVVFYKNPASVIANGMAIEIPPIARTGELGVDYEGELAVILSRDARDVEAGEAQLRSIMLEMLHKVQSDYPDSHEGQRWAPARLGGTAPAPLK